MADEAFRTDDMTLVAVLCMHKYRYEIEVVQRQAGRKRAHWTFRDRDEKFDELVEQYGATDLMVEPQSFVRNLAKVRSEMYREIPPEPRGGQLRAAASSA